MSLLSSASFFSPCPFAMWFSCLAARPMPYHFNACMRLQPSLSIPAYLPLQIGNWKIIALLHHSLYKFILQLKDLLLLLLFVSVCMCFYLVVEIGKEEKHLPSVRMIFEIAILHAHTHGHERYSQSLDT